MSDPIPLPELMKWPRHADRGGYKVLKQIFEGKQLKYTQKIHEAAQQFHVSEGTATEWYKRYRIAEGIK